MERKDYLTNAEWREVLTSYAACDYSVVNTLERDGKCIFADYDTQNGGLFLYCENSWYEVLEISGYLDAILCQDEENLEYNFREELFLKLKKFIDEEKAATF